MARPLVRRLNAFAQRISGSEAGLGLDVEGALARARRTAGLVDFGGESFREALERLMLALDKEAGLTPLGRIIARTRIHGHLVNRLRIVEDQRREPAIAARRVTAPLFIVGPPRTGTSILFRTLASAEDVLTPLAWQLQFPSPPPERSPRRLDRRFLQVRGNEVFLNGVIPDLPRVYETKAELPEECVVLKGHEFTTIMFSIAYSVPSYERWLLHADQAPAYAWHERMLRQLQWRSPGGRWVLKSPEHLLSLDELFARYPEARVVWTHRDPLDIVPSLASLTRVLRSLSSDAIDEGAIGREAALFWASALQRGLAFREAHPALEERFLDVRFEDVCRDPLGVALRIREHMGAPPSAASIATMRRFVERHPRGMYGAHRYGLREFGLEAAELRSLYASYRGAFGYAAPTPSRAQGS